MLCSARPRVNRQNIVRDGHTVSSDKDGLMPPIPLTLSKAREPLGVTGLSRKLGLSKNQVVRVLITVEAQGYVRKSDDKR